MSIELVGPLFVKWNWSERRLIVEETFDGLLKVDPILHSSVANPVLADWLGQSSGLLYTPFWLVVIFGM